MSLSLRTKLLQSLRFSGTYMIKIELGFVLYEASHVWIYFNSSNRNLNKL